MTMSLDPKGGRCLDNGSQDAIWRIPFSGFARIPGPTLCTRSGFEFMGWASTTNPTKVLELDIVIDRATGASRFLLESRTDLVAVWRALSDLPDPITDLTVFANFLCGPCTTAWLLFTTPSDATDFAVAVNGTVSSCAQKGTFFGLSLCELTRLTPGPTTFAVTPLRGSERGPTATTIVTMRK